MYQQVIERAPPAAMTTPLSNCRASLGAKQKGPTQYSLPTTHTVHIELGAVERKGRSDEGWRVGEREEGDGGEGARGWSDEAMMRGRVGAGV